MHWLSRDCALPTTIPLPIAPPPEPCYLLASDSHLAGVPNIPEMLAPQQRKYANYQGVLGDDVVTVATLLEDAGYHTYMAGKWHLGMEPHKRPSRRGFQRTIAMMDSGADNWEQRPYIQLYDQANWFADGERFTLPEDFYSSRFLVDKMIEFIDSNLQDKNSADGKGDEDHRTFLCLFAIYGRTYTGASSTTVHRSLHGCLQRWLGCASSAADGECCFPWYRATRYFNGAHGNHK